MANQSTESVVYPQKTAVGPDMGDAHCRLLERGAAYFLALAEGFLRPLAIGDVLQHADNSCRLSFHVTLQNTGQVAEPLEPLFRMQIAVFDSILVQPPFPHLP